MVTEPTDAIAIDGGAVRSSTDEMPKLRTALRKSAQVHGRTESS